MATVLRRPLNSRQPEGIKVEKLLSPFGGAVRPLGITVNNIKRPRSPDEEEANQAKRSKTLLQTTLALSTTITKTTATPPAAKDAKKAKEGGIQDRLAVKEAREQARIEFVHKYTKAFPSFVFFFDERDGKQQQAESGVLALGARIELFFSAAVTHVITNRAQPPKNEQYNPSNKENMVPKSQKAGALKSPIQLKSRFDHGGYDKLVRDAVQMDKKIWNVNKLESILKRLLPSDSTASKGKNDDPALGQLLENERIHGTLGRDPRERRHDYTYFSKGSHFLLVEDVKNELAPIAIMQYDPPSRNSEKLPSYPVLYMDPQARSPYTMFDEKEEKRQKKNEIADRNKTKATEKHKQQVRNEILKKHLEHREVSKKLLRRASMGDLGTRRTLTRVTAVEEDPLASAPFSGSIAVGGGGCNNDQVASGFGPSTTGFNAGPAYLAASGNSVAITSTTTTSFAKGQAMGTTRLPANLREQLGRQVLMNRVAKKENPFEQRLRKAKSTTTLRLPPREETKKPGYCEACRLKFEDFTEHIKGVRHRKFAMDERNYVELDGLLRLLQRRPKVEPHELPDSSPSLTFSSPNLDYRCGYSDAESSDDPILEPGDYFYGIGKTKNVESEEKKSDEDVNSEDGSNDEEEDNSDEEKSNSDSTDTRNTSQDESENSENSDEDMCGYDEDDY